MASNMHSPRLECAQPAVVGRHLGLGGKPGPPKSSGTVCGVKYSRRTCANRCSAFHRRQAGHVPRSKVKAGSAIACTEPRAKVYARSPPQCPKMQSLVWAAALAEQERPKPTDFITMFAADSTSTLNVPGCGTQSRAHGTFQYCTIPDQRCLTSCAAWVPPQTWRHAMAHAKL